MRKILLLIVILISGINTYGQFNYSWVKSLTNINSTANGMSVRGIKAGANGNVYIMGHFSATTDFDPSSSNFFLTPNISNGCFLAKYNSSGNFIWAKEILAETVINGYETVNDFTIDLNENIYITGSFERVVDFDPSAATYTLSAITTINNYNNYNRFAYTAKYNSNGDLIWAKDIKRTIAYNNKYGCGIKIALDGNNNVYIGAMILDRPFFCKYNNSGNMLWQDSLVSSNTINPPQLSLLSGFFVNNSGEVFVAGYFNNDIDLDPGIGVSAFYAAKASFIGKYSTNGNYIFGSKLNTPATFDLIIDLVEDNIGNIFTCGIASNGSSYKNLITKWDNNGNLQWMNFFLNNVMQGYNGCTDISISCNNNILVTGISGIVNENFDPLGGTYTITPPASPGTYFNFIASYDRSNGGILWANAVGGALTIFAPIVNDIRYYFSDYLYVSNSYVDNAGTIYLCGNLASSSSAIPNDFDPSSGTATLNPNIDRAFFAKYTGCNGVGIEEYQLTNHVSVFPNPSTSQFNFDGLVGENTIQVTDIMGRVLLTEKTFTESHTLKLDAAQGIYFYKITDKQNRVQQGKLILN